MTGTPITVIRHAEAGNRDRWTSPDELRPLTRGGCLQADRVAERFESERFVQIMSSPYVRCMQTVAPLAEARGLTVAPRDDLAEGQPWGYLEKAILEAEGDGPTAICVHGDVLRSLMEDLFDRGIARRAARSFKKGAAWVLGVRDGTVVSARHVPAPPAK
jgi:8-oxo-dGTP diphosphatase